jgi:hypothetical protein
MDEAVSKPRDYCARSFLDRRLCAFSLFFHLCLFIFLARFRFVLSARRPSDVMLAVGARKGRMSGVASASEVRGNSCTSIATA